MHLAHQAGGYELIRRLASGGMGEVFIARRTGAGAFEKRLALKLLLPHLTGSVELVARFYEEARLTARMQHPNIVEVFDVGEADGRPFLAMQLVEGVSLARLIKELLVRGERLPLEVVRHVASGLCEGLSYAHALSDERGEPLKVVHRDVNPSNLLVSAQGAVLLTDFGIARVGGGGLTEPGVVRGTVAYLAPEQILHDAPVDERVDVYAAALTLYELLALHHPFFRATISETFAAITAGTHPPVRRLRPDVSERMEAALERALSRRPGQRFPDTRALREALLDGPVAAGPELARCVSRVCAAELAAFELSSPSLDAVASPGTRSISITWRQTTPSITRTDATAPRRRWMLGLAALTVLLAISTTLALRWLTPEQAPELEALPVPAVLAEIAQVPPPAVAPPAVAPLPTREAPTAVLPLPTVEAPPPGAERAPRVNAAPGNATLVKIAPVKTAPGPRDSEPPRTPVAATAAAPLHMGYLTADAVPWAAVHLGGQVLDRTPFTRYPLPVGKHVLVFKGPGGVEVAREVTVAEGAVSTVRVEF